MTDLPSKEYNTFWLLKNLSEKLPDIAENIKQIIEKHLDKMMDINEEILLEDYNVLQKIIYLHPRPQDQIIAGMRNNILKYGIAEEKFHIFINPELQKDPQIVAYMKGVLIRNLTDFSRINKILRYFQF